MSLCSFGTISLILLKGYNNVLVFILSIRCNNALFPFFQTITIHWFLSEFLHTTPLSNPPLSSPPPRLNLHYKNPSSSSLLHLFSSFISSHSHSHSTSAPAIHINTTSTNPKVKQAKMCKACAYVCHCRHDYKKVKCHHCVTEAETAKLARDFEHELRGTKPPSDTDSASDPKPHSSSSKSKPSSSSSKSADPKGKGKAKAEPEPKPESKYAKTGWKTKPLNMPKDLDNLDVDFTSDYRPLPPRESRRAKKLHMPKNVDDELWTS